AKLGVVRQFGANRFHHHRSLGVDIARQVDDAHAPFAEYLVDLVFSVDERPAGKVAGNILQRRVAARLAAGRDAGERESAAYAERRIIVVFELTRWTALHPAPPIRVERP